jgi:peroxiredoxin
MKLKVGQIAPDFSTVDVLGKSISLKDLKGKKVYLCFLRNTRCPMCSLHAYKIFKKSEEFKALGIETLVFYESDKQVFVRSDFFQKNIFAEQIYNVISDPKRLIYTLYGTEVLPIELANERFITANRQSQIDQIIKLGIEGDGIEPSTNPGALPADFLIDENQILQIVHYAKDVGDQIDLEEIINFG